MYRKVSLIWIFLIFNKIFLWGMDRINICKAFENKAFYFILLTIRHKQGSIEIKFVTISIKPGA
jgi:hypothetical protein